MLKLYLLIQELQLTKYWYAPLRGWNITDMA